MTATVARPFPGSLVCWCWHLSTFEPSLVNKFRSKPFTQIYAHLIYPLLLLCSYYHDQLHSKVITKFIYFRFILTFVWFAFWLFLLPSFVILLLFSFPFCLSRMPIPTHGEQTIITTSISLFSHSPVCLRRNASLTPLMPAKTNLIGICSL